jgi:phage-related minor tail protein
MGAAVRNIMLQRRAQLLAVVAIDSAQKQKQPGSLPAALVLSVFSALAGLPYALARTKAFSRAFSRLLVKKLSEPPM